MKCNTVPKVRLAPIADRVYHHMLAEAFTWFRGWRLPFIIVSRKRLQGWTWNCVDQAVYRTARVFRGEELQ